MTKTLRAALALFTISLLTLVASGCGSSSGSGTDTATLAPPSSILYFEATIDPSGDQESAMRSILGDLPGSGAPENRLHALLQKAAESDKDAKVDYEKDIKPWLGEKVGAFLTGTGKAPAGAVVFATTDEEAAKDAIAKTAGSEAQKKTYNDVEYTIDDDTAGGVVDGFAVLGSEAGVKAAIDASKGESLSESDRYKKATDNVSDDRVALLFQDPGGLLRLASGAAGDELGAAAPLLGRLFGGEPIVATIRAEQQALVIDGGLAPAGSLSGLFGESTDVLGEAPADAWLSAGTKDFGAQLEKLVGLFGGLVGGEQALYEQVRQATGLDLQRDLFAWMGDTAFFVHGDSKDTIGGGALIESKDPAASKLALTKFAAAIERNDPGTRIAPARIAGAEGYALQDASMPKPIFFIQAGERVALAYGEEAARSALADGEKLKDAPEFTRATGALGAQYGPALYLSLPPILNLAESFGAGDSEDYGKARPYLTILDYVVAGSASEGQKVASRTRIGFKPHE
jgi:hypothetical protein